MATLAQPVPVQEQHTQAEQNLLDVFDEIVEDLSPDQRKDFFAELRANAERHGE